MFRIIIAKINNWPKIKEIFKEIKLAIQINGKTEI